MNIEMTKEIAEELSLKYFIDIDKTVKPIKYTLLTCPFCKELLEKELYKEKLAKVFIDSRNGKKNARCIEKSASENSHTIQL